MGNTTGNATQSAPKTNQTHQNPAWIKPRRIRGERRNRGGDSLTERRRGLRSPGRNFGLKGGDLNPKGIPAPRGDGGDASSFSLVGNRRNPGAGVASRHKTLHVLAHFRLFRVVFRSLFGLVTSLRRIPAQQDGAIFTMFTIPVQTQTPQYSRYFTVCFHRAGAIGTKTPAGRGGGLF